MPVNTNSYKNRHQRRNEFRLSRRKTSTKKIYDYVITPPSNLSFDKNPYQTRVFFSRLRDVVDNKNSNGTALIDFSAIKSIDIGSALVLAAELDRWQRIYSVVLSPDTIDEWDYGIVSKLYSLGFFKILKTQINEKKLNKKGAHWIQFISHTKTVGPAARTLRKKLNRLLGALGERHILPIYEPLIESMKNAIEHAYPDEDGYNNIPPHYGKRWWMAASYDEENRQIEIAFLDLGITIPASLPQSWMWQRLYANKDKDVLSSRILDASIISDAMTYRISRTGQYQRGKGFENISKPVELHSKNKVIVVSRKGHCVMLPSKRIYAAECNPPFAGTLIRWYINLPALKTQ